MEEDLRRHLLADAVVAGLVGGGDPDGRVSWGRRNQTEGLPAIVLHRITGTRDYTMEGRSGLVDALVQIDCWAETWLAAKGLARAVVEALDTLTSAPFQFAFIEGERDDNERVEAPQGQRSEDLYRTSLDVRVWHTEL